MYRFLWKLDIEWQVEKKKKIFFTYTATQSDNISYYLRKIQNYSNIQQNFCCLEAWAWVV